MFVVRRAFRNNNKMLTPGSVVEPGDIKLFKTRLRDRRIIEVTEQSLDIWESYFNQKYNASIKANLAEKADKSVDTNKSAEDKPEDKPVVKSTSVENTKAVGVVKPKVVVVAK